MIALTHTHRRRQSVGHTTMMRPCRGQNGDGCKSIKAFYFRTKDTHTFSTKFKVRTKLALSLRHLTANLLTCSRIYSLASEEINWTSLSAATTTLSMITGGVRWWGTSKLTLVSEVQSKCASCERPLQCSQATLPHDHSPSLERTWACGPRRPDDICLTAVCTRVCIVVL